MHFAAQVNQLAAADDNQRYKKNPPPPFFPNLVLLFNFAFEDMPKKSHHLHQWMTG